MLVSANDAIKLNLNYLCNLKREKQPWRSVTFSKVEAWNFTKSNNPPLVSFMFFKLHKWYQIAQGVDDPIEL